MASHTATGSGTISGRLTSIDDDTITLEVPGTSYKLKLRCAAADDLRESLSKRIRGTIHARALRMHAMAGGGRFIEPVWGEPRIVAGSIQHVDREAGRVLINVAVPMWVTCPAQQNYDILKPSGMATFYVESGTRFEPA